MSATLRYDPWGTLTASSGASLPDLRFQGQYRDPETDLVWMLSRWYAPSLGRFISEDSLLGDPAEPPSRHLYAYAEGEPVGRWDPDGREVIYGGNYTARYGRATSAYRTFYYNAVDTKRLRGKLVIATFIPEPDACGVVVGCLAGDDRGWSDPRYPDCFASRICVIVNFDQHYVRLIVRPSCLSPGRGCRNAYPIEKATGNLGSAKINWAHVQFDGSPFPLGCTREGLRIVWGAQQSAVDVPLNPTIDGSLTIKTCKDWPFGTTYKASFALSGDGFPNVEAYYTGDWSEVVLFRAWHAWPGLACLAPVFCDWDRRIRSSIL